MMADVRRGRWKWRLGVVMYADGAGRENSGRPAPLGGTEGHFAAQVAHQISDLRHSYADLRHQGSDCIDRAGLIGADAFRVDATAAEGRTGMMMFIGGCYGGRKMDGGRRLWNGGGRGDVLMNRRGRGDVLMNRGGRGDDYE